MKLSRTARGLIDACGLLCAGAMIYGAGWFLAVAITAGMMGLWPVAAIFGLFVVGLTFNAGTNLALCVKPWPQDCYR